MPHITPFLWFDHQAEAAARFYVSIFKPAKILKVVRTLAGGPGKAGTVMTVQFRILGRTFVALNGGPLFKFTPATSFIVNCRTQAEVDYYYRRLSAGGKKQPCSWLQDKYGLSWQVVPEVLPELLGSKDAAKAGRVMQAMLQMKKIDIKRLQRAAAAK